MVRGSVEKSLLERKATAVRQKDRKAQRECCADLGDYYQKQDRLEEAFLEYRDYADLCSNDPLEHAKALRALGEVRIDQGKFKEGLDFIKQYHEKVTALRNQV